MPFVLTMPKLSPTMEAGTLVKWHKKVDEKISVGDLLFEVATDKATVEHNALDEGWLKKVLIQEGEEASVNQPLAILTEEEKESIEGFEVTQPVKEKETKDLEKEEQVKEEVSSIASSNVSQVSQPTLQPSFTPEPPLQNYSFHFPEENRKNKVLASPLAKKIAKEKGLDLSTVKGSGPRNRIMQRDLALAQPVGLVNFGSRSSPCKTPGSYAEKPLTPMRKAVGQRLQQSKSFIPHFYVSIDINAKPLLAVRQELLAGQIKVSVNDFVVRACALSLREFPEINAGFNSVSQKIIQFETVDLAIAVSLPEGLITPIVRHADYKNLGEISVEIKDLAARARQGQLDVSEYRGGSFTISNLGMFGVTHFQAIINPPQAAILAVGGIQDQAVIVDGQVAAGKIMSVTLSVDHRVIDGAAAANFLQILKKKIENPSLLLI